MADKFRTRILPIIISTSKEFFDPIFYLIRLFNGDKKDKRNKQLQKIYRDWIAWAEQNKSQSIRPQIDCIGGLMRDIQRNIK